LQNLTDRTNVAYSIGTAVPCTVHVTETVADATAAFRA
jgi:hypothetical protein